MAKLRLGMIGTGVAARRLYLPALQQLSKKIEVVACTNRTRRKAEEYAQLAGIAKVVDSAEELIALPEVEAVFISLPIALQPALVKQVLAAGKPVASEKPVAGSVKEGRKLIQATARYSAPWLVAENYAFLPAIARLKSWLDQGKLGEPRLLEAYQLASIDTKNPYWHTGWRQQPDHVGGFVADAGVHLAHTVRRLLGMPTVVKNLTAQFDPKLLPLDTAVAALRFASGALGTWTSCFAVHQHRGPMLRIYGSKGTAELTMKTVTLRNAKGKETLFNSDADSFFLQFSHFHDVVKKGVPVAYGPGDALQDLMLIESLVAK
jgi:predicted dehydrogenase